MADEHIYPENKPLVTSSMPDLIDPENKPLFTSPPSAPPAPLSNHRGQFLYNPPNNDVIYRHAPANPLPPPRRRRGPCFSFLACLCPVFIAASILGVISILIFLHVVQPRVPRYTVEDVRIAELNLENQASSSRGRYVTSNVTFTVNAANPNKKIGIYYDDMDVTLFYEGEEIGSGWIPSFYQGHKNTTLVEVRMEGRGKAVDEEVGSSLRSAKDDGSSIVVEVRIKGHIRVKIGGWKSGHVKVGVKCDVEISCMSGLRSQRVLSNMCKVEM